jgi:hypothetical protein
MIHIVFQEADVETLQKSFALDSSLEGEILQVKDDFAVGPLGEIYTEEGIETRKQWWREVLAGGDYDGLVDTGTIDDNKTFSSLRATLESDSKQPVWIWAAQNKHDVSGYYWLVSQLAEFQGRVFLLYLNNLPFISEKGQIFYPLNLFEIPPREFLKARKLARLITPSEFETDTEEWKRLCFEDKGVRLLEGGKKLVQYGYDFYDQELLSLISSDWIKVNKLIHGFLAKAKHTTGDAYLLWRLKILVESGRLDAAGETKKMKDFEVKIKQLIPEHIN